MSEVVSIAELHAHGVTRAEIARLVRAEQLTPLRRGWYASSAADPATVAAVRAGGALSCLPVLRKSGIWVPPSSESHFRLPRKPSPCWPGRSVPVTQAEDPLLTAFACAANCVPPEMLVAIADSILHQCLSTESELKDSLRNRRHRALIDRCDPKADSGIESVTRFRLTGIGMRVASQVFIPLIGFVDLLIGDCLIVETDGRAYHFDAATFENDRHRDRLAMAQGYLVIRLTYHSVLYDWDAVLSDILTIVRSRRHLWR